MNPLPRAHGASVLSAVYRSAPEDFQVEELPAFEPSGSGEHLLLEIEKRGMNTVHAAKRLAHWAGVGEMAIGYAGLKDRHAVTRQRFSVHLPRRVAPALEALEAEGLRVLSSHWHARKLPRGALRGNRFVLVLREAEGDPDAVQARLQAIARRGLANFFGEQRFGREGDNLRLAAALFKGARLGRSQRAFALSAARSWLFNEVLAQRVRAGTWNQALPGEVWMLAGTHSIFGPQALDGTIQARLASGDIDPTGPMWGRGPLRSADAVGDVESAAAEAHAELARGIEGAGMSQERRSLRLRPIALHAEWEAQDTLLLSFSLPAGSFATVVVRELCATPGG